MGAMKPGELHSLFTQAFNAGDVEAPRPVRTFQSPIS